MTRTTTTLAALLLVLAVAGCSDDAAPRAAAPSSTAEPSAALTAPPTAGPTGPSTGVPATTSPAAPGATAPGSADPGARPAFPPASERVDQGDQVWAVYLGLSRVAADGKPEDPQSLAESKVDAEAVGYRDRVVAGDVDCDRGAREALRLDAGRKYAVTSLFFDTEAQARQFVAAYEQPVVGLARIKAFCLD